jgi:hypothetical protein
MQNSSTLSRSDGIGRHGQLRHHRPLLSERARKPAAVIITRVTSITRPPARALQRRRSREPVAHHACRRRPIVRRADLGDNGIYYHAQVGPFATMDEATRFCADLKAAGGMCSVNRTEAAPNE